MIKAAVRMRRGYVSLRLLISVMETVMESRSAFFMTEIKSPPGGNAQIAERSGHGVYPSSRTY